MTNFAKDLRNASFRGVAFEIDSDSKDFGRRITAHEYPGRDTPYHEDMGASVESFSIDAFICGADFISRGDALESALRKAGPGTLMHPHYGELNVIALSATRRHSSTANRFTRQGGFNGCGHIFIDDYDIVFAHITISSAGSPSNVSSTFPPSVPPVSSTSPVCAAPLMM